MYNYILVPVDGSAAGDCALRKALGLAIEHKARLRLLYIVDDFALLVQRSSAAGYEDMLQGRRDFGLDTLAFAKRAAADAGVQADTVQRTLTHQRIADGIAEEARRSGCDLIVMGTHGRRSACFPEDETDEVMRSTSVPVVLVREESATA